MAKRGGFPGGMMPGNMNNLMKQAQKMQKQMEENQKALEEKEFTATAGCAKWKKRRLLQCQDWQAVLAVLAEASHSNGLLQQLYQQVN